MKSVRIYCSEIGCKKREITGQVRWLTGVFKAQMNTYTRTHNMIEYPEGSPFCDACRRKIKNFLERSVRNNAKAEGFHVNANKENLDFEIEETNNLEGIENMDVGMEETVNKNMDKIADKNGLHENEALSVNPIINKDVNMNMKKTSQANKGSRSLKKRQGLKTVTVEGATNETVSDDWRMEVFLLKGRIKQIEDYLGIASEENEACQSYREAMTSLEFRTGLIESASQSFSEESFLTKIQPEIVYSESGSSEILLETCEEPCRKTKRLRKTPERLIVFPSRSVPYTESFCLICRSSSNRGAIPMSAIIDVLMQDRILVNPRARCCTGHLTKAGIFTEEGKTCLRSRAKEQYPMRVAGTELWKLLMALCDAASTNESVLNFNENTTDQEFELYLGVTKSLFFRLRNELAPFMRDTNTRTVSNALAIFLTKLRLGLSQRVIGFLYGIPSQLTISLIIHRVANLLEEHLIPRYLGWKHLSRADARLHQTGIASQLFNLHPSSIAIIADGTYVNLQKPRNHELQYKTYCLHKHRNLVKMMMIILEDGYVLEADGPWLSYSKNNDACIFKAIMERNDGLRNFTRPKDLFILDRGFGEIINWLEETKFIAVCPHFLGPRQRQFTSIQANENRRITKIRFRVENANGRISQKWNFFDKVIEIPYIPLVGKLFKICCAINNMEFRPIVSDVGREQQIVEACLRVQPQSDTLMHDISVAKIDKTRKCWKLVTTDDVADFPRLSESDLLQIDLGTYQIKNADQYILRSEFYHHDKMNIIRGNIRSRFHYSTTHKCYVEYIPKRNSHEAITRRCCTCITGLRVFGTCSHIMAVIYLFGFQRYNGPLKGYQDYISCVLDAADILTKPRNQIVEEVDTEAETEVDSSDDDEWLDGPRNGFPNVGNSCYLNSSLQPLFTLPDAKRKFKYCSEITTYYNASRGTSLSVDQARGAKRKLAYILNHFSDFRQHDAQEFLLRLLNLPCLRELKYQFEVNCEIRRFCNCGSEVTTRETELGFNIQPQYPVQDEIAHVLSYAEPGFCECGKLRQASKKLIRLPKYALVTSMIYRSKAKISNEQIQETVIVPTSGAEAVYQLISCITHIGKSIEGGHYKCFTFGSKITCFNDVSVFDVNKVEGDVYVSLYVLQ